jgi:chromosome segregation ATPase
MDRETLDQIRAIRTSQDSSIRKLRECLTTARQSASLIVFLWRDLDPQFSAQFRRATESLDCILKDIVSPVAPLAGISPSQAIVVGIPSILRRNGNLQTITTALDCPTFSSHFTAVGAAILADFATLCPTAELDPRTFDIFQRDLDSFSETIELPDPITAFLATLKHREPIQDMFDKFTSLVNFSVSIKFVITAYEKWDVLPQVCECLRLRADVPVPDFLVALARQLMAECDQLYRSQDHVDLEGIAQQLAAKSDELLEAKAALHNTENLLSECRQALEAEAVEQQLAASEIEQLKEQMNSEAERQRVLEAENAKLKEQLAEESTVTSEIEQLKEQLNLKAERQRVLEGENENVQGQLAAASMMASHIEQLEQQLHLQNERRRILESENEKLKQQLATESAKTLEIERLTRQLDSGAEQHRALESQNEKLRRQLAADSSMTSEMERLKQQLNLQAEHQQILEAEKENLKQQLAVDSSPEIEQLKKQLSLQAERQRMVETENEELKKQLNSEAERQQILKSESGELREHLTSTWDVAALKQQLQSESGRHRALQSENKELAQQLAALKPEVQQVREQLHLEAECHQVLESKNEKLKQQLNSGADRHRALESENEALKSEIARLKQQVNSAPGCFIARPQEQKAVSLAAAHSAFDGRLAGLREHFGRQVHTPLVELCRRSDQVFGMLRARMEHAAVTIKQLDERNRDCVRIVSYAIDKLDAKARQIEALRIQLAVLEEDS